MELWRLWVLRGPNAWAACPVIEAGLDLGAWADRPPDESARAAERVAAWLSSLAPGVSGGVVSGEWSAASRPGKDLTPEEGRRPTGHSPLTTHHSPSLAHLVGRVALRLQTLAG